MTDVQALRAPAPVFPLAIVIVNWNGLALLQKCLASVARQTVAPAEVWVVDNGSTDGSAEWLQANVSGDHLILNHTNAGFAPANNQALRRIDLPWILLLNNDTELEATCLAQLQASALATSAGLLAPAVLQAGQDNVLDSAGMVVDLAGFAWNRGRSRALGGAFARPAAVFGAPGSAMLVRKQLLDQVGLLDESFFAYYEDVDLCWRAQLAGWRAEYVPGARLWHIHSATLGRASARKQYLISRNRLWCLWKNYPAPALFLLGPIWFVLDILAGLSAFFLADHQGAAAWRGRAAAWKQLARIAAVRRQVQALRSGRFPVFRRLSFLSH
jgi:GT2 family glycosyltransferase